jgi:glycosyltransferase involved in cell wall biosynthesis
MAMGRPVVATDAGGPRETVEDGITGWLVPMGDPRAMADRIGSLLADSGLRQRMGAAGRRRVVERFSMDRMIQALESSYDEVLARSG